MEWCERTQHPGHPARRLILVFDQFEEVLSPGWEPAGPLLSAIKSTLETDLLPVTILVVMWDAFYSRLLEVAPFLSERIGSAAFNIPPTLSRHEVEEMIRKPAQAAGLSVENDLIKLILEDSAEVDSRGGKQEIHNTVLPLLQIAMADLWYNKTDGVLAVAGYRGIRDALTARMNNGCKEFHDHDSKQPDVPLMPYVRRTFIDLVEPGSVAEGVPDARRRWRIKSLYRDEKDADEKESLDSVITRLVAARLLVVFRDSSGQEWVEIIHDAVVAKWGELQVWLQMSRRLLDWRRSNGGRIKSWTERGRTRSDDALLRGQELSVIEALIDPDDPLLSGEERAFLEASRQLRSRAASRRRRFMLLLCGLLVLASASAVAATWQWAHSRESTRELRGVYVRSSVDDGFEQLRQGATEQAAASFAIALREGEQMNDPVVDLFRRVRSWIGLDVGLQLPNQVANNRLRLQGIVRTHKRVNLALFHDGPVTSAQFSPDPESGFILTVSQNNVFLWTASDGKRMRQWRHPARVLSARFDPKGQAIVTSSDDHVTRVWRIDADRPMLEKDLGDTGRATQFDASGERLVLLADRLDGQNLTSAIVVYRLSDGQVREIKTKEFPSQMYCSPAAQAPVAVTVTGPIARIFNLDSGRMVAEWLHQQTITAVTFRRDGRIVATGGNDSVVQVHETRKGTLLWFQSVPANVSLFGLQYSQNSRFLAVQTARGAMLLEAETGRAGPPDTEALSLLLPEWFLTADRRRQLTVNGDGSIRVLDLAGIYPADTLVLSDGEEIKSVFAGDGALGIISKGGVSLWAENGTRRLNWPGSWQSATIDSEGALVVTDAAMLYRTSLGKDAARSSFRFTNESRGAVTFLSPDGRRLAAVEGSSITVWNVKEQTSLTTLAHPILGASTIGLLGSAQGQGPFLAASSLFPGRLITFRLEGGVLNAVFSPTSDHLVTLESQAQQGVVSLNSQPVLWDASTGKMVKRFPKMALLPVVSFSRDGRRLVIASSVDFTAQVFEANRGEPAGPEFGHPQLRHAALGPDGRQLLTCGGDGACRVWDVATGERIAEVTHSNAITAASFDSDGRRIITAGLDKTVWVWDVESSQALGPPMIHKSVTDEVWFTPDGRRAVSVSLANREFRVWDVGDDPSWTTEDLILFAEFISSSRVGPGPSGLAPLDRGEAVDAFGQLNARHPEAFRCTKGQVLQFLWRQAMTSMESGEWQTAAAHLEQLLADPSYANNPGVIGPYAHVLTQLKQYDRAEGRYLEALAKDPKNAKLVESLAFVQFTQGKAADAAKSFKRAIELHGGLEKSPAWIISNLGTSQAALGQWDAGADNLRQAIKAGSLTNEILAYRHLALALLKAGRIKEYESLRSELVAKFGKTQDSVRAHATAAILLLTPLPASFDPAEPTTAARDLVGLAIRATSAYPGYAPYKGTLGAACYRVGRNIEATQFLRQAIE